MSTIIRPLTETDLEQVETVVASRDKFMLDDSVDRAFFVEFFRTQLQNARLASVGAFLDGTLDAFMLWRYHLPSPRADDPTRLEETATSYIMSNWSRARPDREKTSTGHDVISGQLSLAQLEAIKGYGVYTSWTIQPSSWRISTDSPITAAEMQKWTRREMAVIPPGEMPQGPGAEWLSRTAFTKPNTHTYPLTARAVTLRDEHR